MHKTFLQVAAILGALSVALGAFAAHGLKKLVPEEAINIFETGVRYQFYHVFALAIVAMLFREFDNKWMLWAGYLFIVGIILFSGSLYFLTYVKATDRSSLNWVGAITPLGGLAFIAGWMCIFISVYKSQLA